MFMQHRRIDFDAVALNARNNRHQRHFNMLEYIQRTFLLLQFWPHFQMQLQSDVGVFRRVTARFFQRDLIKRQLIFAFTRDLFKGDGFMFQPAI
ncbi:hypothetical protein D3C87_1459610 [compost metagenome]